MSGDADLGIGISDIKQHAACFSHIRNPQIRYSIKVRPKTTFSLAVEKASSDIAFKVAEFSAQPNSPSPDGTLQLRREMDRGHLQLAALF